MVKLNGVIVTTMGIVVFTDGKIDTINNIPFEAGDRTSQKLVIRAVADKLREGL